MKINYFFVLEGIDGSGKSTTIEIIKKIVKKLHYTDCFVFLYEPTDLTYGRIIRQYLKENKQLSLEEWLKLFDEDRKENLRINILPNQDKIILMDRYYFSTAAYQSKEQKDVKTIMDYFYYNFPIPTMVFYFDISIQESLKRIQNRNKHTGKSTEVFEKEEELNRVLKHYKYIYELSKDYHINWQNINTLESPHKIAKTILRNVFSKVHDRKKSDT